MRSLRFFTWFLFHFNARRCLIKNFNLHRFCSRLLQNPRIFPKVASSRGKGLDDPPRRWFLPTLIPGGAGRVYRWAAWAGLAPDNISSIHRYCRTRSLIFGWLRWSFAASLDVISIQPKAFLHNDAFLEGRILCFCVSVFFCFCVAVFFLADILEGASHGLVAGGTPHNLLHHDLHEHCDQVCNPRKQSFKFLQTSKVISWSVTVCQTGGLPWKSPHAPASSESWCLASWN